VGSPGRNSQHVNDTSFFASHHQFSMLSKARMPRKTGYIFCDNHAIQTCCIYSGMLIITSKPVFFAVGQGLEKSVEMDLAGVEHHFLLKVFIPREPRKLARKGRTSGMCMKPWMVSRSVACIFCILSTVRRKGGFGCVQLYFTQFRVPFLPLFFSFLSFGLLLERFDCGPRLGESCHHHHGSMFGRGHYGT
jgi:hypothetical protein